MTSQETKGSPFYSQQGRQVKEFEIGNSSHNAILFRIRFLQQAPSKSFILHPFKGRTQLFIFYFFFFFQSRQDLISHLHCGRVISLHITFWVDYFKCLPSDSIILLFWSTLVLFEDFFSQLAAFKSFSFIFGHRKYCYR